MTSSVATNRGRRPYSFGKLYDVLQAHFPDHRSAQRVFDIPKLASDLGLANETLYRAVRGDEAKGFPEGILRVSVAIAVIRFSHENHPEEPLYWDHLIEFVLPEFEKYTDPLS